MFNVFVMMFLVMKNIDSIDMDFSIPSDVLDEIQANIQDIIQSFDIPDDNKLDVIKKINFMYTQTKHLSETDALTKLYNRRHFENNFDREFARSKRYGNSLSVAIIDIDFFKKINDTYGHLCGDFILREVAYKMINNFRQTDFVFRYGGEEFAVILTETPLPNAEIPLERLRKQIENSVFSFNGEDIKVTISVGISSNANCENAWEMFANADKVLYEAKNSGRNRVKSVEQ